MTNNNDSTGNYFYEVFGLTVQSHFELKELLEIDPCDRPDISASYGKVIRPAADMPDTIYKPSITMNKQIFFLELKDNALFLAEKIDDQVFITVDVLEPENLNMIMSWFYGSILTAALQMQNRFALHASAVSVNGELHLFCGKSGIGKSTIAAQLHSRGYNLFSDDKCVLTWHEAEQRFYAEPSIQIMRLWQDATDNIEDDDFLDNPEPLVNRLDKFQYIIKEENKIKVPMPVARIHLIRNVESPKLAAITVEGMRKLKILKTQTHRFAYLKGLKKVKDHWQFIEEVAKHVPLLAMRRPVDTPIHDWVDFIESKITKPLVSQV